MKAREALVPPAGVIPPQQRENYYRGGREFVFYMRKLCSLGPAERVLEVGSGGGRLAIHLAKHLAAGSYEGFDVIRSRVRWCQDEITTRYPNFRFQLADVYNKTYNPSGETPGSDYTFPYPDGEFDFVFAVSVFTHMMPADVEGYLSEFARVLRGGGRCLATYFLLNEQSLALIQEDKSRHDPAPNAVQAAFTHDFGTHRVSRPSCPEGVVAYREEFILELYEKQGLEVREPIRYGRWSGRSSSVCGGQDVIVADR